MCFVWIDEVTIVIENSHTSERVTTTILPVEPRLKNI